MTRREVFRGRIVDLGIETVVLPNGESVELEIIRHPGAAAIVPLHEDGTVTLVHQYRHAAGGMIYEVPAGVLEPEETPELCARRELAEEVQLRAATLTHLIAIHTTPGFTDERIHLFLAQGLTPTPGQPEADEVIEPVRLQMDRVIEMITTGQITDAKTICALFMAREHVEKQ